MAETVFPNGVDVNAGHVGNVPAYVTADGARVAAGTTIVTAGSVTVATGLTTVAYAVACPYGQLASTAGTVGGFVVATAAVESGGSVTIRGYDQQGTASLTAGTAAWWAVGT